eukprot:99010_1
MSLWFILTVIIYAMYSQPTAGPTPNPTHICNTLRDERNYDFIIMYDNSCGLNTSECNAILYGVGELVFAFIGDDDTHTRVQTMEFNANGSTRILVGFNDTAY